MWLIGSKTNIQAYIAKVDKFNQYQGDKTVTWAVPTKHKNKELFAVIKNESVEPETNLEQKQELPNDWHEKSEL